MKRMWLSVSVFVALAWANGVAWGQGTADKSVGDLAAEAATDLVGLTGLVSVLFYVVGATLVGVGLLKIKRHSDQPQQVTLGSGLVWIFIGVALIVAPWIINAVAETFGTDASGAGPGIAKPKL